ncbi:MAG: hypothetical protein ACO1OT_00935 [Heyndrickxia sp.]
MGYILPISLYSSYWKIETSPLKIYPSERAKLLFQPYSFRHPVDNMNHKKEKTIFNEIIVSPKIYIDLTGKGSYINILI